MIKKVVKLKIGDKYTHINNNQKSIAYGKLVILEVPDDKNIETYGYYDTNKHVYVLHNLKSYAEKFSLFGNFKFYAIDGKIYKKDEWKQKVRKLKIKNLLK